MPHLRACSVHEIKGDDPVKFQIFPYDGKLVTAIHLPGGVDLFFDGDYRDADNGLIGFLDQMHAIRNGVIQDMSDRSDATPAA